MKVYTFEHHHNCGENNELYIINNISKQGYIFALNKDEIDDLIFTLLNGKE